MKFNKILVINIDKKTNLDPKSWKKIESFTNKILFLPKDDPRIKTELADADCLLVNFFTPVTKDYIDLAKKLKYIGIMAVAYRKVEVAYAKNKRGIISSNLKGYSTESVAEFIIAAILEHLRSLEEGKTRVRLNNYSETGISATEIKDKIFGVIGLGSIGQRVAVIANGFGADVRYWSRNRKKEFERKGIKYQKLDNLVSESDFISINLAQNSDTNGLFNRKRLQNVKAGTVIINTCPMELIDIDALEKRLKNNDITFILDHSDEMSEADLKKLSKYKNCIIYPPIAYVSKEAAENKKRIFLSNIENFLKGKPTNVVN